MIKRREFIAGLGSAAAWPVVARAQQSDRMRHIGVLTNLPADDAQMQTRNRALLEALQRLGWTPGRNVEIEYRWGGKLPTAIANMQRSWWRSHPTSSSPLEAVRVWRHYSEQHARCRLCSPTLSIRSARVSSRA